MDKYQNSTKSLNSTFPTNRLLNTGPLYTMCEPKSQQQGPQLLMNSASVGTATQFQFVPARNSSTNFPGYFPLEMGNSIFNSVKTFFVNLIKPKVDVITNSTYATYDTTERRKCNSTPNIYMDSMSNRKCSFEFEKNSYVDLSDSEMLAKLSASTKSFSDYNLPTSPIKINCTSESPEVTKKMDLNVSEEPQPKLTKEIEVEMKASVVKSPPSPVPVPQPNSKQRKHCMKMPKVATKPQNQCVDGKRTSKERTKKSTKTGKNKREKERHELALNIHEDVETENENMSADEWLEPLVIISETKTSPIEPLGNVAKEVVCFSKDDFPAMPSLNSRNNSNCKQTWELPRLSHCFSLKGRKQRQISECDSEDSFIVFDSDDKATPSSVESNQSICDRIRGTLISGRGRQISESSEDDFICFEMEPSDTDDDADTSDSESEVDVKSIGTNPPDSGFEEKKVRFNLNPVVHVLRVWSFAHQQARKGEWEQIGRDRDRFQGRVKRMEPILLPILNSDHRQKIYQDRFLRNSDSDNCDNEVLLEKC